jgi:hypothetical protein
MASFREVHYTLTLDATVQSLPFTDRIRWFSVQPDNGNSNAVYMGGTNWAAGGTLSSTDYGTCLPAPVGGVQPPPHIKAEFTDGSILANDVRFLGTNGEKVHIHALIYV